MKAAVYERYGSPDVLKIKEIEKPEPKEDEILIKIKASSINSADHRMMRAKPFFIRFMGEGIIRPKRDILGIDMAGVIEKIGSKVTLFKPGDAVFGDIYETGNGAFCEYICAKETANIVGMPENITFEQAASVPVAGLTALQALRDHGGIKSGDKVLVNGASGGVGTFTVMIAKAFGAEVTGVCSERNVELVRDIGADRVIDYGKQDFRTQGEQYNLIIDIAANIKAKEYARLLKPEGKGILVGFSSAFHMMNTLSKSKKLKKENSITVKSMGMAQANKRDLIFLGELMEQKKITPAIDKIFPLEKTSEAMNYFEKEHAKAKVVISME